MDSEKKKKKEDMYSIQSHAREMWNNSKLISNYSLPPSLYFAHTLHCCSCLPLSCLRALAPIIFSPWSTPSFTVSPCLNTFSMRLTLTILHNMAMYLSLVFLILFFVLYFFFFTQYLSCFNSLIYSMLCLHFIVSVSLVAYELCKVRDHILFTVECKTPRRVSGSQYLESMC